MIPTRRISKNIKENWFIIEQKLFLSYFFIETNDIEEFEKQH